MKVIFYILVLISTTLYSQTSNKIYYCEYCGTKASSVKNLVAGNCQRHPNGNYKGKHKLYEGTEKKSYTCKLCGTKSQSISNLTAGNCQKHPNGAYKGKHSPAL